MIPLLDTLFTERGAKGRSFVSVSKNFISAVKNTNYFFPYYIGEYAAELAARTGVPLLTLLLPKLVIDSIQGQKVLGRIFLTGVALLICCMAADGFGEGKYYCYNASRNDLIGRFFCKTMDGDFQELNSPQGQQRILKGRNALLWGDGSGPNMMHQASMEFLVCLTSFAVYAGIFLSLRWWMALFLMGLSAGDYLFLSAARKKEEALRGETADLENRLNYIERASGDIQAGKDVRIFGLAGWLEDYMEKVLGDYRKKLDQIRTYYFVAEAGSGVLILLRDAFTYLLLILLTGRGQISGGDFVLYAGAVSAFGSWISRLMECVNSLKKADCLMEEAEEIIGMGGKADSGKDTPKETAAPEKTEKKDSESVKGFSGSKVGIRIEGLNFSYENTGKLIFRNLNLVIHPGEKLALVGANGAGKTTLIQLMCGLFRTQKGEIFLGNRPVSEMSRQEQYDFFSVVFQEPAIFPLTVAENIALCRREEIEDVRVRRCLEQTGLWKQISAHEKGLDAPMTRLYHDDGIVLSGGQQQMFLLARALYKDAPVLILDEPTAAMDALAEQQIYKTFFRLSKGKTVIFISHRLASTRFCDRILLMEQGKITEEGSHEELIRQKGQYARIFAAQSSFYQEEGRKALRKGGAE